MDDITIEMKKTKKKNPFYKSVYIFQRRLNWRETLDEIIEIETFFLHGLNWTLCFIHCKDDKQQRKRKPTISICCSNEKRLTLTIYIKLTIRIVCRNKTKTTQQHNPTQSN